jgi:hypothetical protein
MERRSAGLGAKAAEKKFGHGWIRIQTDERASLIFISVNSCPSAAQLVSAKVGSPRFLGTFRIAGDFRRLEPEQA